MYDTASHPTRQPEKQQAPDLLEHVMPARSRLGGAPWWAKTLSIVVFLAVAAGTAFTLKLAGSVGKAFTTSVNGEDFSVFQQIQQLIIPPQKPLRGETDDRINILLLGIGGAGHDGAYLTDTIILASYKPSLKKVALFSIPRDLVVPIPGAGTRKINYANALGEESDEPGAGPRLTARVIENVFQQPVHYFVRVDFAGFEKLIDDVGGINVTVDAAFTDHEYPNKSHGYQTISFLAGPQQMNGDLALKFVRSRKGSNGEGSDFARSRRQQKVLLALKHKVFSLGTLLNPSAITQIVGTLGNHVQTDVQPWEVLRMASIGKGLDTGDVMNRTLDTTRDGLLVNETGIDGAYILVPRDSTYGEMRSALADVFSTATGIAEHATIDMYNGTTTAGLAAQVAGKIASQDITVRTIANAQERDAEQTVIYDLTNGAKPVLLARLKSQLNAEIATTLPSFLQANGTPYELADVGTSLINSAELERLRSDAKTAGADFVILVGQDQASTRQTTRNSALPSL